MNGQNAYACTVHTHLTTMSRKQMDEHIRISPKKERTVEQNYKICANHVLWNRFQTRMLFQEKLMNHLHTLEQR